MGKTICTILLSLFSVIESFAQLSSREACFYSIAGQSGVEYIVRFDASRSCLWTKAASEYNVKNNLAESKYYYENETWRPSEDKDVTYYKYDSSKSTSKRVVYRANKESAIGSVSCIMCNPNAGTVGTPFYNPMFNLIKPCGQHGYETVGYKFVAFSQDLSSFIYWDEPLKNNNGEINHKQYYSRVPKERLLPKAANYDFLSE